MSELDQFKQKNGEYRSQVSRELGEIDAKLCGITLSIEELKSYIMSYEERIRKLEDWKLTVNAKVSVIAIVVSGGFSLIVIFIDRIL